MHKSMIIFITRTGHRDWLIAKNPHKIFTLHSPILKRALALISCAIIHIHATLTETTKNNRVVKWIPSSSSKAISSSHADESAALANIKFNRAFPRRQDASSCANDGFPAVPPGFRGLFWDAAEVVLGFVLRLGIPQTQTEERIWTQQGRRRKIQRNLQGASRGFDEVPRGTWKSRLPLRRAMWIIFCNVFESLMYLLTIDNKQYKTTRILRLKLRYICN